MKPYKKFEVGELVVSSSDFCSDTNATGPMVLDIKEGDIGLVLRKVRRRAQTNWSQTKEPFYEVLFGSKLVVFHPMNLDKLPRRSKQ